MPTVYRLDKSDHSGNSSIAVELEYRPQANNDWWVVGEGFTDEHRNWQVYEHAIMWDGKDPAVATNYSIAYFIDEDRKNRVTKDWLLSQKDLQHPRG